MRLPSSCIHRVIEKAPSTLTPPSRITALLPTCRSSAASRKLHDSHTPMPSVVTCRMRASILMEARLGPAIPYPAFPTAAQVSNDGWANAFQFQSPTRPFQLRRLRLPEGGEGVKFQSPTRPFQLRLAAARNGSPSDQKFQSPTRPFQLRHLGTIQWKSGGDLFQSPTRPFQLRLPLCVACERRLRQFQSPTRPFQLRQGIQSRRSEIGDREFQSPTRPFQLRQKRTMSLQYGAKCFNPLPGLSNCGWNMPLGDGAQYSFNPLPGLSNCGSARTPTATSMGTISRFQSPTRPFQLRQMALVVGQLAVQVSIPYPAFPTAASPTRI